MLSFSGSLLISIFFLSLFSISLRKPQLTLPQRQSLRQQLLNIHLRRGLQNRGHSRQPFLMPAKMFCFSGFNFSFSFLSPILYEKTSTDTTGVVERFMDCKKIVFLYQQLQSTPLMPGKQYYNGGSSIYIL